MTTILFIVKDPKLYGKGPTAPYRTPRWWAVSPGAAVYGFRADEIAIDKELFLDYPSDSEWMMEWWRLVRCRLQRDGTYRWIEPADLAYMDATRVKL